MNDATHTPDTWPIGKELPGGYRVTDQLGQGGMGTVYRVEKRVSTRVQRYAIFSGPCARRFINQGLAQQAIRWNSICAGCTLMI